MFRVFRSVLTSRFSFSTSSNTGLVLSESCVKRLKQIGSTGKSQYLRVLVEGGGCSGFQYKFDITPKPDEDDLLFEREGAVVVVDPESLNLIRGSTLDYQEELIRSGFKIIGNPKAEKGCSCGVSFAVNMD